MSSQTEDSAASEAWYATMPMPPRPSTISRAPIFMKVISATRLAMRR